MSDDLPLRQLTVLVTRAREQAGNLSRQLEGLGATVVEFPVLAIAEPSSWEPLDTALRRLEAYDWLVFASVNAVEAVIARMRATGLSPASLEKPALAAIGPATADALAAHGLTAAYRPVRFIAEGLVEEFPGYPHLAGRKILWPRTNIGRTFIADRLREAGASVETVECYRTELPANPDRAGASLVLLLSEKPVDVITLASAQSARNLACLISAGLKSLQAGGSIGDILGPALVATIGPETSRAARAALGRADIEAQTHTTGGLVEAIVRSCAGRRPPAAG